MAGDARDEAQPRRERPRQRRASEPTERRRRRREEDQEKGAAQREEPGSREASADEPATRQLGATEAAKLAVDHVTALTGRDSEGVTSLERTDDGWLVGVEVVESHRVPDSTDVLAVYEAELDHSGELVSYRRRDRYARGRGNER
ncbi:gas vesicle protein GvpO [Saccharopolyspora sp. NPDC049426]|uniref:gas vesicle protein GvpO n=1 Tax=Saccharopolyspora sp. NPDC049426 TaxID=3155652 RepID=UPI00342AB5F8